jgi:hypothetical protein
MTGTSTVIQRLGLAFVHGSGNKLLWFQWSKIQIDIKKGDSLPTATQWNFMSLQLFSCRNHSRPKPHYTHYRPWL